MLDVGREAAAIQNPPPEETNILSVPEMWQWMLGPRHGLTGGGTRGLQTVIAQAVLGTSRTLALFPESGREVSATVVVSFSKQDSQERIVDEQPTVVFDEAEFAKLIHEGIHPAARGADHLRQGFL